MSEMKDSNVKWIGKIPAEWSTKRVKYLATKPESLFIDGDWIESDIIVEEGIRYLTTGNVGAGFFKEQGSGYISEETFKKLKCLKVLPGDLMISRLNEPIGRACIVPDTEKLYVVAVDNVILRPDKEYNKQFIMYCMNTTGYAEAGKDAARGSTMQRVSRSLLGTFTIPITNIEEQQLIVTFLNNKVKIIDKIIEEINSQIIIINEYKKTIINDAVTKGISSDVNKLEIKIGRLVNLKQGLAINAQTNYLISEEETSLALLRIADMNSGMKEVFMNEKTPKHYIANKEDIIYTRTGQIGLVFRNQEGVVHNNCFRVIPKDEKRLSRKYLYWVLKSDRFYKYANMLAVGSAQPDLAHSSFKQISTTLFNLTEQELIADYLDKKCKEIDTLIKDKQEQVEKIRQYKKSLIYEYVTGKKRVKGAEELYG